MGWSNGNHGGLNWNGKHVNVVFIANYVKFSRLFRVQNKILHYAEEFEALNIQP